MPKMKTHKGAKGRVKITGRGKVMAMKPGKRHLNYKMSGKKVREKRRKFVLFEGDAVKFRILMPYDWKRR